MSTEEIRAMELLRRVSYRHVATSMRAMPCVVPARHIVAGRCVIVRLHRGLGHHRACDGGVVAYGSDNLHSREEGRTKSREEGRELWSVQVTGTARIVEPTEDQLELLGAGPALVDGLPFDPVHMRIEPQFVTVHTLDYSGERQLHHVA